MNFYQPPFYPLPQSFSLPYQPQDTNVFNEQSYVENILRDNINKVATIYMNFEGSQWGSKVFKGEILEAGKDHLIIKDLQTNMTYMLLTIYLSYVAFDEDIEYEYPFS